MHSHTVKPSSFLVWILVWYISFYVLLWFIWAMWREICLTFTALAVVFNTEFVSWISTPTISTSFHFCDLVKGRLMCIILSRSLVSQFNTLRHWCVVMRTDVSMPFVTTYHPGVKNLKQILMQKWSLIQNQPLLKTIYTTPPFISYKKGKSLKDMLVRAKLLEVHVPPPQNHIGESVSACLIWPLLSVPPHYYLLDALEFIFMFIIFFTIYKLLSLH